MQLEERLTQLIAQGDAVLATKRTNPNVIGSFVETRAFAEWAPAALSTLKIAVGEGSVEYQRAVKASSILHDLTGATTLHGILVGVLAHLRAGVEVEEPALVDAVATCVTLFERFHLVARLLRQRHADRPTLDVEDEYDAQDLLHALLAIHFDDIRPEEWAPSYAGGSARADFLLKKEQLVIEVKHSRKSMTAKDLGEQLIIDIAKYAAHPDCKRLLCFVYDPDGHTRMPRAIESDLTKMHGALDVKVFIRPV